MVADSKAWRNGPSKAGERCAVATQQTLYELPATEPYLPTDCDGLFVRGLTAKDFHVLVDGAEQKIQSVTSESDGLRIRDNLGLHNEFSQTPAGKWSTKNLPIPHYSFQADYGLLARNRYDLSFVPSDSSSTGCHKIEVAVDRRNSIVAARDQYCASESPPDILNGTTLGERLARDLTSDRPAQIPLALQVAVFSTDRRGRMRMVLEFPPDSLRHQWRQDWTLDATIGVLGTVYRRDGTVASRFSDFACCTAYSKAYVWGMRGMSVNRFTDLIEQFGPSSGFVSKFLSNVEKASLPVRYETHIDLPPDEYDLRVALSDGENFGTAEARLKIENDDGEELALSSVMLCKRFRDAHVAAAEAAAANFAPQYVPMVSKGIQVTPAGDTNFEAGETLIPYFEIYTPEAGSKPSAQIQVHLRIVDAKNGAITKDFPPVDVGSYMQPGNTTTIPVAREVPIATLSEGEYRLEVQASDAAGRITRWRTANFSIISKR